LVRLLCSVFITLFVFGCTKAGEEAKEPNAEGVITSVADTAAAKTIPVAEAKIEGFALNLKVGDTFKYKVTQENNTDSDNEITRQSTVHIYKQRVIAVKPDGTFDLGMEFVSTIQDVKSTNPKTGDVLFEQHYNSSDTADFNNVRNVHLSAVMGMEVVLNIDKNCRITGMKGVDKITAKIVDKTPNFPEQYKAQLTQQIENVMFATFASQEFLQYPEQKLDSSYTWETVTKSPLSDVFDLKSTTVSKITGVKKLNDTRLAQVNAIISGEIFAREKDPNLPVLITVSKSGMSGTLSALVDAGRGTTVTKEYKINMSVTGTVVNKANKTKQNETKSNSLFYKIELIN